MMPDAAKSLVAAALVLSGLYLVVFGNSWAPTALELLPDTEPGYWLELIVPFLPVALIGFGAALFVSTHRCK